ncbi:MAG: hypothetical protein R6T83_09785 [Salinibacter sp.]
MSKFFVLIIACFLLGGAQVSAAQVSLRVGGGAVGAQSPGLVQDAARRGIGGELGVHLPVRSWLRFVPTLSYYRMRTTDEWTGGDGVMTMGSGTLDLHYMSPRGLAGVRPYALTGVGGHRVVGVPSRTGGICPAVVGAPCIVNEEALDTGLRLGLRVGGGATVRATSRVRLFGELRYARVVPTPGFVAEGETMTFLSGHAGLLYAW